MSGPVLVAIGLLIVALLGWIIRELLDVQTRLTWVMTTLVAQASSLPAPPPPVPRERRGRSSPGTVHGPEGFFEGREQEREGWTTR